MIDRQAALEKMKAWGLVFESLPPSTPFRFREVPHLPEVQDWFEFYTPPWKVPEDSLIVDVGARTGDSAAFFLALGYTNLRLVEPRLDLYQTDLEHNVEVLRSMGCKIDLHLHPFKSDCCLNGAAFAKFDCEGCETEVDFSHMTIPWSAEIHFPLKKLEHGIFEYMPCIGYHRWTPWVEPSPEDLIRSQR